jgi:hypothetical protein
VQATVYYRTIEDLIDDVRSHFDDAPGPAYDAAGRRLAAALAKSGPVLRGTMIYRDESTAEGWGIRIEAVPGLHQLLPLDVRWGWRAERPGDLPDEANLSRRYGLPLASQIPAPVDNDAAHRED